MKVKALSPNVLKMNNSKWYQKHPRVWDWKIRFDEIRVSIYNFFFARYNIVKIREWKRTQYHDADAMMFHSAFQILVDYVELELPASKKRKSLAGIAHLNWEIELGEDSPEQSHAAREIRDLYLWYTCNRSRRKSPYENCPIDILSDQEYSESEMMKYHEWGENALLEEQKQEEEDQSMFIRLVKVRRMMWT